jgi:hypothetical protein
MPRVLRPSASEAAKPDLIHAASLARGTPVVIYCRVSEFTQVSKGSLDTQIQSVWKEVRGALGLLPRALVDGRERGKLSEDRPHLGYAIELALHYKSGIIAATLPRFLRSEAFDKETNWGAVPTPEEIDALLTLAAGVPFLATIIPPDTPPEKIHGLVTQRGAAKAKSEGRWPGPKSKFSDKECQQMIHDRADGASFTKLANDYGYPRSTIVDLFKKVLDPKGYYNCSAGRRKRKGGG